jgi:hypothetical protein
MQLACTVPIPGCWRGRLLIRIPLLLAGISVLSMSSTTRCCEPTDSTRAIKSRLVASPLEIQTYFFLTLFLTPAVFSPPFVLISAKKSFALNGYRRIDC